MQQWIALLFISNEKLESEVKNKIVYNSSVLSFIIQHGAKVGLKLWAHETQSLFLNYYILIFVYFPYKQR